MKRFNHAFDIGFSVESDNEGKDVTASELKAGLAKRLASLLESDEVEIIEACGLPFDTYENEDCFCIYCKSVGFCSCPNNNEE